jgi:hypothetical protein
MPTTHASIPIVVPNGHEGVDPVNAKTATVRAATSAKPKAMLFRTAIFRRVETGLTGLFGGVSHSTRSGGHSMPALVIKLVSSSMGTTSALPQRGQLSSKARSNKDCCIMDKTTKILVI